jgi:hypothetical protein
MPSRDSSGTQRAQGAAGEVLGQLDPDRRVGDDPRGGDQLLDPSPDVGGVPRRPPGGQPGDHLLGGALPVQRADRARRQGDRPAGIAVAEGGQLAPRARRQLDARLRGDLVRAALGPGAGVPGPAQRGPGVFAGVRRGPFGFVAVRIAPDLCRPRAERAHIVGELLYFSSGVEAVAVRGQRRSELRVAGDRGVPDTVDCGE